MTFEPQQYSAIEIAHQIINSEEFDFSRNIFGQPIFFYNLRRKKMCLPDGEISHIHALGNMTIRRNQLKYREQPLDEIVIGELRGLLGEEAKNSFSSKDSHDMLMRYDYLDESYSPNLPERIIVRVEKKWFLEHPETIKRNREDKIAVIDHFEGSNAILRPPFSRKEDVEFLVEQQNSAFRKMAAYASGRGIELVLPTRDS